VGWLARRGAAASSPAEGAGRWVHVGRAYVYVGPDERIAIRRAPTRERVQAVELAVALREQQKTLTERGARPSLAEAEALLVEAEGATTPIELAARLVEMVAQGANPAMLASYADALLVFLKVYVQEGRYRDALRLASLLVGALLYMKKWLWIVEALGLARQAADRLGDAAETAWVLHDLGTLAVAAGVKPIAVEALEQAKDLYERVGDHAGAEASSSALSQSAPLAPSAVAVTAAVGAVLIAGAVPGFFVGGGTWYFVGGTSQPEGARAANAEVTAFAVGNDNKIPGEFEDRTGSTPPSDAVAPGETLAACKPLYVYDWVRFEGIESGTTSSSEISVNGRQFAIDTRRWDSTEDYTVGSVNYNGSGGVSSGTPIPYGRWELVVRIEGVEVDRARVTLEEAC
jgi:hypothetical protein